MKAIEHAAALEDAIVVGAREKLLSKAPKKIERLPFTIRVVRDDEALRKAVAIRQAAYGRHMPALGERLRVPEPNDYDAGSVVLLAESKMDGSPIGTMRIQTNRFGPLSIEQGVTLPAWLKGRRLAEATRLGVDLGRTGRVVKMLLCKAFYLYSLEIGIKWMIIGARPPVDRQYEAALFTDIFPGEIIPMRHFNNIPHRVLGFEVDTAAQRWSDARHPLHQLMVETHHPDIDLSDAEISAWDAVPQKAEMSRRLAVGA